ncbi:MAG: hypothetical protein ACLUOI_23795 [Eisenbergiella sp.]
MRKNLCNFDIVEWERFWVKEDGSGGRLFPDAQKKAGRRLFVENSAIYITKKESLIECNSVLGKKVNGYVIDASEGVDINELSDIMLAESLLLQEREEIEG